MIPSEVRDQVLRLHLQGHGIRWIAHHVQLSRNSVRRVLRSAESREETPGECASPKASLLDPYKSRIRELLEEEERQRKKHSGLKPLTTRRILKELRKSGYSGGRTILDTYLREVRGPGRRTRKPHRRFETPPAEEGQQDWSPYRVDLGGTTVVIQLFSLILCWSRYQFLRAYLDQQRSTLLQGHVAAFHHFCGVPWRIVYDRQATISPCEVAGKPVIDKTVDQFRKHYGFEIILCRPGHKERKGKVEKPFLHFETSFLPLRKFESLEDLNCQLACWLDGQEDPEEGNRRRHGTTGEVPYERWLQEKRFLYKLPPSDLVPRRVEERSVNHDCTISVGSRLYTVPAELVEQGVRSVWVSIGPEDILVYDKRGQLVAQHRIPQDSRKLVINEEHYRVLRKRGGKRRLPEIERQFLAQFPSAGEFLERLKSTLRSIAPVHLRELLGLARRYRTEEIERAFAEALRHGTATAGYVRQILGRRHPTARIGELHKEPPLGLSLGPVDPGSTANYGSIFETETETERR